MKIHDLGVPLFLETPKTHLANGPWKKSLNFIFPTKYVIPKSLKFSHWPSKKIFTQLISTPKKQITTPSMYHPKNPQASKSKDPSWKKPETISMVVELVRRKNTTYIPLNYIYCLLGGYMLPIPPFRGTRNNHWKIQKKQSRKKTHHRRVGRMRGGSFHLPQPNKNHQMWWKSPCVVHPRNLNLTWIPNIAMIKRSYLFRSLIFGIHVRFLGCNP